MTHARLPVWICALFSCGLMLSCTRPTSQQAAIEATLTIDALSAVVQSTLEAAPATHPTPTPQPAPASATPEPAPSVNTPAPSPTAVPAIPQAVVSENTNCRSGPGTVYDLEYSALAGGQFTIVAGSSVPEYVIIEIPGNPGQTCWLWTRYASISGDINSLPKQTPPPTPTPSVGFSLEYNGVNSCVGWGIGFKITNTGSQTLKSVKVTVEDTDTDVTISQSSDDFDKQQACLIDSAIAELEPGDKGYAYAYAFVYDPAGHELEGKVTACTQSGLGGQCSTRTINFEP